MNLATRSCAVVLAAAMGVSPVLAQSTGKSNSINNATTTMTTTMNTRMGSFPLLAWSWGASYSGTMHMGGGSSGIGGGKTNIQDLSITRYVDRQSTEFLKMMVTGDPIDSIRLERGGVSINFEDVLVTSISTGGSAGERSETLTENISLNFAVIRMTVDGKSFCYNAAEQRVCAP